MTNNKTPKRRIRQNIWGNWYGYEGTKRVREFSNGPYASAEQDAQDWLNRREGHDCIDAENAPTGAECQACHDEIRPVSFGSGRAETAFVREVNAERRKTDTT